MQPSQVIRAWGRILTGYRPVLSIEITKGCPLSCPGCYAYQPNHVGGAPLTSLSDTRGDELVEGVMDLVDRHRPLAVYLVGGEPLIRFRELNRLIPEICSRNINTKLVTSAVCQIPSQWASVKKLEITVSIDGLQPEHDARRKPATYSRILKNIQGHRISVHCTVTSQMMQREEYLGDFVRFWSDRPEVRVIRMSFFTPQIGEKGIEILTQAMREKAVRELDLLRRVYSKLQVQKDALKAYLNPPENPESCIFARVTRCVTADLKTSIEPCQFGGTPNCRECGCAASMGLHALGQVRLGGIPLRSLLEASTTVGAGMRWIRERVKDQGDCTRNSEQQDRERQCSSLEY